MTNTTKAAFISMFLCLTAVGAYASTPLPVLRVMQVTGKLQVTTEMSRDLPQGGLQYIPSGSYVRVESGEAWFESYGHVMIKATEGGSFLYSASSPDAGNRTVIQALGRTTSSLDVHVGGLKYLLKDSGAISIALSGEGLATVQAEGGDVSLALGSELRRGESVSFNLTGKATAPSATVQVPAAPGFMGSAIDPASLRVTQLGASTLSAERLQADEMQAIASAAETQRLSRIARQEFKAEDDLRSALANMPAAQPAKTAPLPPQIRLFSPGRQVAVQTVPKPVAPLWRRILVAGGMLWAVLAALMAFGGYLILRKE